MKTILITGANSGIGKATTMALAQKGNELILVCRNEQKAKALETELKLAYPNALVHVFIADLSVMKSIQHLVQQIQTQFSKIDVLINDAGAFVPTKQLSADGFELTLATNHLSYFYLTQQLLPLLHQSQEARIVNVASEAHKIAQVEWNDIHLSKKFTGMRAYANSKLFNIMFTYTLANQLQNTSVTVNAMHPGGVNTNFGNSVTGLVGIAFRWLGFMMRTPEQGAETVIWLAENDEVKTRSGGYYKDKKTIASSAMSYDKEAWQRLWQISEELIQQALA